jgi:hypothetical protein
MVMTGPAASVKARLKSGATVTLTADDVEAV